MSAANIQLKKFDMTSIKPDKVCVFIGKRETGKSFLVRDLLFHHRTLPVGTVISATESANCFYGNIIPPIFIHDEYKPEIIANVLKKQKKMKQLMQKDLEQKGTSQVNPNAFLILDDCLYDASWSKDPNIKACFMNGRHWHIFFIITMQFPLGIPPSLRTNIDYVFILRENIVSNRKRIYDNYAGMFPSFEVFCQVMDQCTENYECLVIHNNAKSNKLNEQVYWYKANDHPTFRLCAEKLWLFNKKFFNPSHDDDEITPTKKNFQKVNVKKIKK